ncbi:MAG: hypothetical protein ACI4HN_03680 [Ruminococcus sp.]
MSETINNQIITDPPYSYHTFLLAFHFDGELKDSYAPKENWVPDSIRKGEAEELLLNYQNFQYFTPEARKLMFDEENNKRFIYDIPQDVSRKYIIKKTIEEENKETGKTERLTKEYKLLVNNIIATVFSNINIAIFQLEVENHNYRSLTDIKRINEYGRRINLPFIMQGDGLHPLVADSITLLGITEDFNKFGDEALKKYITQDNKEDKKAENDEKAKGDIIWPILKPITKLLPGCTNFQPVIDDRMFVCCLVRDEEFSNEMKSFIVNDDNTVTNVGNNIYTDKNLSNKLYSFAFIDADSSSCQSPEMREALLKRCVYSRWRDRGTIDVVTHHSFVRITGESKGIKAGVINPFLTQYITMASGVLLQRATILRLSSECSKLAKNYFEYKSDDDKFDEGLEESIKTLKRMYVYAQNYIFLNQFTVQEQGIDEFDMLKNELYIDDSLKNLDNKINSIYDFTTEYSENEENSLLNVLTKFGLPLSLIQTLAVIVSFVCFSEAWHQIACFVIVLLVSVIISAVFFRKSIKKYIDKRKNTEKHNSK